MASEPLTTQTAISSHNPVAQKTIDLVQTEQALAVPQPTLTAESLAETVELTPSSVFDKVKQYVNHVIDKATNKATALIEEDLDIPLSQESVNGLVNRYVVQKVKYFTRLTAELTPHNFYLSGDMHIKGINISVSGEFDVVTFELNDKVQHMVFRQLGKTKIDKIECHGFKTKLMTKVGLFYIRHILRRDPLAFALEYFDVATVADDQYDFEIGRYFRRSPSIMKQLKRFQVKHAFIRDHKIYLTSGVKVSGFTDGLFDNKTLISDDDMPEESSSIMVFDN